MLQPGKYVHYKHADQQYQLIGIGRYSEDMTKEFVIYQALYEDEFPYGQIWVRPLEMWLEPVIIDGVPRPRFIRISD
jgi:hypothetical protein